MIVLARFSTPSEAESPQSCPYVQAHLLVVSEARAEAAIAVHGRCPTVDDPLHESSTLQSFHCLADMSCMATSHAQHVAKGVEGYRHLGSALLVVLLNKHKQW